MHENRCDLACFTQRQEREREMLSVTTIVRPAILMMRMMVCRSLLPS